MIKRHCIGKEKKCQREERKEGEKKEGEERRHHYFVENIKNPVVMRLVEDVYFFKPFLSPFRTMKENAPKSNPIKKHHHHHITIPYLVKVLEESSNHAGYRRSYICRCYLVTRLVYVFI
jgi:hypothetical protein